MSDLAAGQRFSISGWVIAGLAAFALHVGIAVLAYTQIAQPDDTDVAMGSPAIDIGLVMTAPHTETSDLPPGALAEDALASQAMPARQAKIEKSDLPKQKPINTDNPDRLVSENPVKEPEDTPKPETVQSKASTESIASEASTPPPSEKAPEASRSVAPVHGIGDSNRRVIASWQRQLVAYLDHRKRYPKDSAPRNATIVVDFTIDRLGHVLTARITRSSDDAPFDDAALAMLHRSDPVPPPPALLADEGLSFSIPVIFRAKRH